MYFSWGSSLGKELKYISVYPTAYMYTCEDGLCAGDIDLPWHAHALPGVTWACTCISVHMCVL